MIQVKRGPEPNELVDARNKQLPKIRALGRDPFSNEISREYAVVAEALCIAQHYKCCYCEYRIVKAFNDVEHYRPKGSANRKPGSNDNHGYWWLAYTWENLLFACNVCNRSSKNDLFPLKLTSVAMRAEDIAPCNEMPLLIDPSSTVNPVEHIQYCYYAKAGEVGYWWAEPRNGSLLGLYTIDVCDLNRKSLREMRGYHIRMNIACDIDRKSVV